MKRKKVLICDADPTLRQVFAIFLKKEGFDVQSVQNLQAAKTRLEMDKSDILLVELASENKDSFFENFYDLRNLMADGTVIVSTQSRDSEYVLSLMEKGADDVLFKPLRNEDILLAIRKQIERQKWVPSQAQSVPSTPGKKGSPTLLTTPIITQNAQMSEILQTIAKIAEYKTTVLITGESGTGKELIARAIHEQSSRSHKPFITVNCGAIPENLLESELFGHIKGAFTGAVANKKGLFEEADSGTIFLDEIGELPLLLQVKLLRVLQEEEVRRVGDVMPRKIDVRVIAATLKDLVKEVAQGTFREDLYYRLNVLPIHLPPLRSRKEDIPSLLEHFIVKVNKKLGSFVKSVHPEAMKCLMEHDWPGNIRELENTMERSMVLVAGDQITLDSLPKNVKVQSSPTRSTRLPSFDEDELSIKKLSRILEEDLILKALKKSDFNRTKAAKLLEISHRALLYKIKRYKIEDKLKS